MFRKMSFGTKCLTLAKIPILFATLVLTYSRGCFQVRLLSIRTLRYLVKKRLAWRPGKKRPFSIRSNLESGQMDLCSTSISK